MGAEIYSRWLVVVLGGAKFLFPIVARTMKMMIMTTITDSDNTQS